MNVKKLREETPLIVNITNDVVINYTANGLLALGASPVMGHDPKDVDELLKVANGLLINMGIVTSQKIELVRQAIRSAYDNNVKVVYDPVGYGATQLRNDITDELLHTYKDEISLVKGNLGEISALSGNQSNMRGVDSIDDSDPIEVSQAAFKRVRIPILVTGKKDVLTTSRGTIVMENGVEMSQYVTGSGCLLGSIVAAFLSLEEKFNESLIVDAVSYYNLCAEKVIKSNPSIGPGTFRSQFIDALFLENDEILKEKKVKYIDESIE